LTAETGRDHCHARIFGCPRRRPASGRLGGMIEDADGALDLIDETVSGLDQADTARVTVKDDDAKVVFQRP